MEAKEDKNNKTKEGVQAKVDWDAYRFIEIPVYSDTKKEDGTYDLIGFRKEYI